MNSASVFHLGLFGNRSVLGPDGVPLTGQAVQRHRMALLALLALSAGRGVSREKLMGYLWPEREPEQARQLLNQAVYTMRKALRDDAIVSSGEDLRLNPEVVRADVAEFEVAMAHRDYAEAVRLYSGPFLDAFAIGEAPEFDWWADRERQRLTTEYARALEALAEEAARNGDQLRAVECWKTRTALDPYDSRLTLRLMEALAASGNRAGALRHASIHERLLQSELGASPPADVLELAERLRRTAPATERPARPPDEGAPDAPAARALPEPRMTARRRPLGYGMAGLALGIIGLIAVVARLPRRGALAAAAAQPSIAVLPLANLSPDARDAFLADGMTEELIGSLAKSRGLRVIASTSVFAFRRQPLDARRVADSLHVAHLVEGDVQKIGDRLRVRVRLVDARDGVTRWSETYDRELRDVFAVEDDITRAVVRELGLRLAGASVTRSDPRQTRSVAAHELYLRGNDPVLLRSDSGAQAALGYLQQAVALDSTYAAAYAGLSRIYLRLALSGGRDEFHRDRLGLAERYAVRALALDDSLADAHATLALVQLSRLDLGAAESHLRHASDLEPAGARFHEWLVKVYVLADRPADALRGAQRALELDPLSPTANAELAHALLANGRADEALAQLQSVAALRPPLLRANIFAAQCYMKKGMYPQAIALLRTRADRGGMIALGHLGYALARSGRRQAATDIRDTLVERSRRDVGGLIEVALVSAGLDERDQAFAWLESAIAAGAAGVESTDLLFESLRHDPRFERIRAREHLHD